ncbi:nitroreductase family protein [Leifsonia sp. P73]|uniref:nitroreductase family protein n=1 Tax=Leifsonia sp. P73 TaxID=3423959 RepID=UPI003DA65C49
MDLQKLMSRHLTRYFDGSKTIPEETLEQLLSFLRSTPSSVNIQPNHFYVLSTEEGKRKLADNLGERFQDNAEKVMNASHVVILTTRTDVPDDHLDAIFAKERADGRFAKEATHDLWESMTRDFLNIRESTYDDLDHWMEKQTYMALGMTMMAAAELGIDATPLEGFDRATVDKAFGLEDTGYTTTVLLALGYPDPAKAYATPISRFDRDKLFTFM